MEFLNSLNLSPRHLSDSIWSYKNGNYELLREKASAFDWQPLENDDLDIYANNINSCTLSLAAECIQNKHVRIKPLNPSLLDATIKS